MTDLLIAAGTLGALIEAINDLSQQPDLTEPQDRLALLAYDACRPLFLDAPGVPIDLRLPNLGSPRAQRMFGTWAALAPRLFLPLGLKSLFVPLLRGIADAARDTGHAGVTPLAAGITVSRGAASVPQGGAGARPAARGRLPAKPGSFGRGREPGRRCRRGLDRHPRGDPDVPRLPERACRLATTCSRIMSQRAIMTRNPRAELGPHLKRQLGGLTAALAGRPGPAPGRGLRRRERGTSLIEGLYDAGFRTFSIPAAASAEHAARPWSICHKGPIDHA